MEIIFQSIGTIFSPFKSPVGMPIQSASAHGVQGKIILLPEFEDGVKDLDGFSHIILLYNFHKIKVYKLLVKPFLDNKPRGVFATRAPQRPNQIGLSIVKLLKVDGNILHIENIDILDGTPLLDIKPYVPMFDEHRATCIGWLENTDNDVGETKSDTRFFGD